MILLRALCLVALPVFLLGCENAEDKARYVKEPMERISSTNRASLNAAVNEAKTRLVTVRDDELRSELSGDIDDAYARGIEAIERAEYQEAERLEAEAQRRRELERQEAERVALERQKKIELEQKRALEQRLALEQKHALEQGRALEIEETRVRQKSNHDVSSDSRSDQVARRNAAEAAQLRRAKEGVTNLEVRIRNSALGDGTKVLVLRNSKSYAVDFDLRCYTVDERARTLAVTVPAGAERHIGFLEGWCGNFRPGQRCEAYVDGELMWTYRVQ